MECIDGKGYIYRGVMPYEKEANEKSFISSDEVMEAACGCARPHNRSETQIGSVACHRRLGIRWGREPRSRWLLSRRNLGKLNEAPNRTKRELPANRTMAGAHVRLLQGYLQSAECRPLCMSTQSRPIQARVGGHDIWLAQVCPGLVLDKYGHLGMTVHVFLQPGTRVE